MRSKLFQPIQNMLILSVLICLVGMSQGQQTIQVAIYDEPNFQGNSVSVGFDRCVNIPDFEDRAASIVTRSQCVMLYTDPCCQGPSLTILDDVAQFPENFTNKLSALSPCGSYRTGLPASVNETWLGHSQTMNLMEEDGDIAVYYNDGVSGTALANHVDYIKKVWSYAKSVYGEFGPEGGRINAFVHANVSGPVYGFNSIRIYFDPDSSCRNLIDVVGGPGAWSNNLTGTELDVVTHEISHIIEGANKNTAGSPSYGLWGDSKWAEIFIYDVYNALGMTGERDRFAQQVENGRDNFPRPDTYWFKNWFYPVYSQNGGVRVLNNCFTLLSQFYPRSPNGWQYIGRSINLGEFVHFFSGAAGRNLESQARIAFAWDDDAERELRQAKIDFPEIRY